MISMRTHDPLQTFEHVGSEVRAVVGCGPVSGGHLLTLHVTPANADDHAQVERLAKTVQAAIDDSVEVAFVDQLCRANRRSCRWGRLSLSSATRRTASSVRCSG